MLVHFFHTFHSPSKKECLSSVSRCRLPLSDKFRRVFWNHPFILGKSPFAIYSNKCIIKNECRPAFDDDAEKKAILDRIKILLHHSENESEKGETSHENVMKKLKGDYLVCTDLNEFLKEPSSFHCIFVSLTDCPFPMMLEQIPFVCRLTSVHALLLPNETSIHALASEFSAALDEPAADSNIFIIALRKSTTKRLSKVFTFIDSIFEAKFPKSSYCRFIPPGAVRKQH